MSPPWPVQLVWKMLAAGLVETFVGMGAEVVALGLQ